MTYYERHLPHWDPEDAWIFVTWRLYGSIPRRRLGDLERGHAGREFSQWDRELDRTQEGPRWMSEAAVAEAVMAAVLSGALPWHYYELRAWVVMPNHVHILILPKNELPKCLCAVKTISGRDANRILGRTGQPFWQQESYDHWVRDGDELERVVRYIEKNPVRAGFVSRPEEWPWSSAHEPEMRRPARPSPLG